MKTKKCKKCEIEKPLNEFNRDKYSLDGLRYRCRECTKQEYRSFYYKNQEEEIKRTLIELSDFNEKISNLQYMPTEEEILFSDDRLKIIGFKMENEPYCLNCDCLKDKFFSRIDDEDDPDFDIIGF